jgi:amino-acid N-acetyltransferase
MPLPAMTDLTFSQGAADDDAAVRALLVRCGLPEEDLRPAQLEDFVVCRAGHELVGSIGLEPLGQVALLRSLAVTPSHRGRRVAHLLWEAMRRRARDRGVRRLYLLTTTAQALFDRWGFQVVSRAEVPDVVRGTAEYATLCSSTAVVMTLELR